jgi:hypothetical protein
MQIGHVRSSSRSSIWFLKKVHCRSSAYSVALIALNLRSFTLIRRLIAR